MFKWKVGCHNIIRFLENALLISVTLPIEVKKIEIELVLE